MGVTGLSVYSVVIRRGDLLSAPVDHELVMLDPETGHYHRLDPTGLRVWELLAERQSVEAICHVLELEFDVSADTCRAEVLEFLGQLAHAGLLQPAG